LISLKIADDIENFKPHLHFAILVLVADYRMQRDQKGNRLPFATAPEAVTEHRMQIRKN
jgi:hypothetical protein